MCFSVLDLGTLNKNFKKPVASSSQKNVRSIDTLVDNIDFSQSLISDSEELEVEKVKKTSSKGENGNSKYTWCYFFICCIAHVVFYVFDLGTLNNISNNPVASSSKKILHSTQSLGSKKVYPESLSSDTEELEVEHVNKTSRKEKNW